MDKDLIKAMFPFYQEPEAIQLVDIDLGNSAKTLNFDKVLFLDFDGVLHPLPCRDVQKFCFMNNFCEVLQLADPEHTLPIVISSTWRHRQKLNDLRVHFPDDVASQIVGVTPYWTHDEIANFSGWSEIGGDASKEKHRQREILLWMKDHAPKGKWLAIDDRPEYFHEDCEGLFIVPNNGTNGYCGLTTKVSYDFFEKLKAFLH